MNESKDFRAELLLIIPAVLTVVGLAYLALGFMADSGSAVYIYGPMISEVGGSRAAEWAGVAQIVQDGIEVTWAVGSFLGYGGPILWMAILFLFASTAKRH